MMFFSEKKTSRNSSHFNVYSVPNQLGGFWGLRQSCFGIPWNSTWRLGSTLLGQSQWMWSRFLTCEVVMGLLAYLQFWVDWFMDLMDDVCTLETCTVWLFWYQGISCIVFEICRICLEDMLAMFQNFLTPHVIHFSSCMNLQNFHKNSRQFHSVHLPRPSGCKPGWNSSWRHIGLTIHKQQTTAGFVANQWLFIAPELLGILVPLENVGGVDYMYQVTELAEL